MSRSSDESLVSVIVPVFNRAAELPTAIQSIRDQSYGNVEIIVVDDASTDDTPDVVKQLASRDLLFFQHDRNRGGAAARNTGIKHASGEYVAFLDSDDRWKPDKLARQIDRLNRDEDTGFIYTGTRLENEQDSKESGLVPSKEGDVYRDQLERDWLGPTSTWLVKRDCFETVGRFNPGFDARQDYEMSLRITEEYSVDYVPERLVVLGTDAENRLTDDVTTRIENHVKLIDEEIKPRAKKVAPEDLAEILSVQYFTLGRYCQRYGQYDKARQYLAKAREMGGWDPKRFGAYLFAQFDRDVWGGYYRVRDWLRKLRLIRPD